MSNMLICKPLPISLVTITGSGSGGANLQTIDPKEVFQDGGGGSTRTIDIDLGSAQAVDSFALGFLTPSTDNITATVNGGTGAYTDATIPVTALTGASAVTSPQRKHIFARLAAPVTARYVRFVVTMPNSSVHTIGIVAIGLAFQPTYNREWGSGRVVVDTGSKEALLGGGFGIGEGARKMGYRWTFGDLTDAEVETLADFAMDRGETRPVVVVEDPATSSGLNERIHYGLFDRFEAYERLNPSQTRWSLSMTEWV